MENINAKNDEKSPYQAKEKQEIMDKTKVSKKGFVFNFDGVLTSVATAKKRANNERFTPKDS